MMQPAPVPQMSMDPHQQQPPQMGAQIPQQQQWMMQPPQYQQAPPPPAMWGQQPPPAQVQMAPPQMQPHQQQMQTQQQQQYVQQHQQQQQYVQQHQQPASADEVRTLWIGDLQYWMDESYIYGCFSQSGEVISVKIIRNKQSGQSEGYGFIEFANRAAAERALQAYNGALMPNVEQSYRLNWASFGVGEKRPESGPDFPIFVGDLASDVSDYILQETFRGRFTSVKGAKVVTDRVTGRSKGYGFVRFGDEGEQIRAMTEMNGVFCSTRPMRIGPATTKKTLGTGNGTGTGTQQTRGCSEALFT